MEELMLEMFFVATVEVVMEVEVVEEGFGFGGDEVGMVMEC